MYDQFYGLSGRPFQLTPDPHYYFESGTHRKALSYLGYGLAQGEGFIVITGEVGSGKSTLVSHLMQTIDRARLTAATIVTSQLDAVDLVGMTAESFGIDTRGLDKAAALKAIENFLHAEARAGRRCLLVVDEAQNLTVDALEELRMLSNFQLGSTALLQIFLLGQPEFRDLIKAAPELEQLRQRVIATHHLEAMEAEELKPYVEHRLGRAGWSGRPQLTTDAYDALFDETGGVPRKINAVMNRCLLMGAVEQVDVIDGALVEAVIADMAGKPFSYEAPMSSKAPVAQPLPEAEAEEAAQPAGEAALLPEEVEAAVEAESLPVPEEVEAAVAAQPLRVAENVVPLVPPVPVPAASDTAELEVLAARVAQLEARMADQDDTMRRVLAMLIDWMEKENQALAQRMREVRAA